MCSASVIFSGGGTYVRPVRLHISLSSVQVGSSLSFSSLNLLRAPTTQLLLTSLSQATL